MANIASARKRARKALKTTARLRARRSRMRTFIRRVERFIEEGKKADAQAAFRDAMSQVHRGVTKGVMHPRTAARRLSRLSQRVRDMVTSSGTHVSSQ